MAHALANFLIERLKNQNDKRQEAGHKHGSYTT